MVVEFRQAYPLLGTFLDLNILSMPSLCCQRALCIIQNSQDNFWTWVWPRPPRLNNVKKNCTFLTGRLPLWLLQHHQGDDSILNQPHTTLSVTRSFRIWKDLRVLHFVLLSHCHSIFNIITGWCCLIILFCIVVICILSAACIFLTLLFFSWVVLARNSAIGIVRNIIFHWRLIVAPACISQFLCCQQAT